MNAASKPDAELTDEKGAKKKFKTKHKRQGHGREKFQVDFDIPGVTRIILGKRTQKELDCIVGEQVTNEHPWKFVLKELIEDSITFNVNSEFLPLKQDIAVYPRDRLLLGYSTDETNEYDEFYLCLDECAEDKMYDVVKKIEQEQEVMLESARYKIIGMWNSLGSDAEIEEYTEKSNRALLEVEVESAYPILSPKARFKIKSVCDATDGYVELLPNPDRQAIQIVQKLRTDCAVQISPLVISHSSQTHLSFPKQSWTQYYFEYDKIQNISEEYFQKFSTSDLELVCDHLQINHNINFYTDDYIELVTNTQYTVAPEAVKWDKYLTFSHLLDARNKMISSVSWHPMWSGTIAIAYAKLAPNMYSSGEITSNELGATIHDTNPVLIWRFDEELKPKLYLECHRQVECISFCPFDENIIVGASNNGQVIVWDIRNKLNKTEEVEVLTTTQQKYRVMMRSLMMGWMKNNSDVLHVRSTIESDFRYSHANAATGILWLPPYCKMTKAGKYELIENGKPQSLQFATSSSDGSILFWDLLQEPNDVAADKSVKFLRLKTRSSALITDASPYTALNKILRPIYKLTFFSTTKSKFYLLSSIASYPMNIHYENCDFKKTYSSTDKVIYRPIITPPTIPLQPEIYCGSYEGYMLKGVWAGCDPDSENLINQENCTIMNIGNYHDGPVTSIEKHPLLLDTYLSVGGKVFSIWNDNLYNRPIFWRKSRCRYTHGTWTSSPGTISLSRSDGNQEIWNILRRSGKIYYEQSLSGQAILGSHVHTLQETNILGISDYNGTFRMFHVSEETFDLVKETDLLKDLFEREVLRKQSFTKWQDNWLEKHADLFEEWREMISKRKQRELERAESEKRKKQEQKMRREKERQKLAALAKKPAPGEYFKCAAGKWRKNESNRMHVGLLMKKQLNPDALLEKQKPLKKLEEEEEIKKQKQNKKLHGAEGIFKGAVAMLFPDVIQKKPSPPLDPYGGGNSIEDKLECMAEYEVIVKQSSKFVESHPFEYKFNWKGIVKTGRDKRRIRDNVFLKRRMPE